MRKRYDLQCDIDQTAIDYDMESDGMYPLLTNDRHLSPVEELEAHKKRPTIEKRFEQLSSESSVRPCSANGYRSYQSIPSSVLHA